MKVIKLSSDLTVSDAQIKWLIAPSEPIYCEGKSSLLNQKLSKKNRVKLSYFSNKYLSDLERYKLDHKLIEELKARVKRKEGIDGYVSELSFIYHDQTIFFTIEVLLISKMSYLLVKTRRFKPMMTPDHLRSLSELPFDPQSMINDLSRKCFAVLKAGNLNARPTEDLQVRDCFPHIFIKSKTHQTIRPWSENADWRALATIGLRHSLGDQEDLPIINKYKQTNLCIREHLVLIDKQSMLVVSDKEYVENDGMLVTCLIAKHLAYLLSEFIENRNQFNREDMILLLDRLERTFNMPSLISESETTTQRWPVILRTFKIDERIEGARHIIDQETLTHRSPDDTLRRLDELAAQIPDWPYHYGDIDQKLGEEGLNIARKTLEKIAKEVISHLHHFGLKESKAKDLNTMIQLITKPESWRTTMPEAALDESLTAYIIFIQLMGNKGSHDSGVLFVPPKQSCDHAMNLLVEIMNWFVYRFLRYAFNNCPNCNRRCPSYNILCICKHRFEQPWYQSCHCKFSAVEEQNFCLQCGKEFVRKGEEEATLVVQWLV